MNETNKDNLWEMVSELVEENFGKDITKEKDINMQASQEVGGIIKVVGSPMWDTIEQFKTATGQRFRMTKEQKQRGITREEAFSEFRLLPENTVKAPAQGS